MRRNDAMAEMCKGAWQGQAVALGDGRAINCSTSPHLLGALAQPRSEPLQRAEDASDDRNLFRPSRRPRACASGAPRLSLSDDRVGRRGRRRRPGLAVHRPDEPRRADDRRGGPDRHRRDPDPARPADRGALVGAAGVHRPPHAGIAEDLAGRKAHRAIARPRFR